MEVSKSSFSLTVFHGAYSPLKISHGLSRLYLWPAGCSQILAN